MRLTIAYSKIKKRNPVLINNDTHQTETLSERPIRLPLNKLEKGPKMHFEDKILAKCMSIYLVIKIYY